MSRTDQEHRMRPRRVLLETLSRGDPGRIGTYLLVGRLGTGAMGRVYLGRSPAGRLVAVKTIRPEYAEEPDFRARFAQEVAAARRVSGVFTAAVVAADPEAAVPWLATAYVPAPSLDVLVEAAGPLPVPAVRWLAAGCAEALESIHHAGLVHRDLKPSNVLVSPDGPRVIDFGVARAVERIALTSTHGSVGTPAYMAPEQARDTRHAIIASDVYSLGSTVLFAATGHAPHRGETVIDVLVRLATEPADLDGLPRELGDLVASCLERDPSDRPTPAAILAELAPYLESVAGRDFGSALPEPAKEVLEEYRKPPRPQPRQRNGSGPGLAGSAAGSGGGPGPESTPGAREAQTYGSLAGSDPAGGDATIGSQSGADGRAGAGSARWPFGHRPRVRQAAVGAHRGRRRVASVLGLIVAAVALVALGGLVGGVIGRSSAPSVTVYPPPPGPRDGPPPDGEGPQWGGPPAIAMNQRTGDGDTTFVVRGTGWQPGKPITIRLDGDAAPVRPVADRGGRFNYTVNQDHEFFRGPIPPGTHTVVVTDPGNRSARAGFEVHP